MIFQESSSTCPVCRKNARIRQILCFPVSSTEQTVQLPITPQTSTSTIQLLRIILEPKDENHKNVSPPRNQMLTKNTDSHVTISNAHNLPRHANLEH